MSGKIRWTFEADFSDLKVGPLFVTPDSRPTLDVKESLLPDATFKIDASRWRPIKTTFRDVELESEHFVNLYRILATVYELGNDGGEAFSFGEVRLAMWSYGTMGLGLSGGAFGKMEEWVLKDAWPQSINFIEMSHSQCESTTLEVTWRFNAAQYLPHYTTIA